ncbi:MAG: hypothetical protein IIA62_02755 [Nitrospinae bacterium]|nr:hypothetical protein [Nitrospinota bacterium]
MDFVIVKEQILGIILFVSGIILLTWCSRIEREDEKSRRDPAEKWSFIDGERDAEVAKRNIRGLLMTLVGAGMAIFGFISFILNIKITE